MKFGVDHPGWQAAQANRWSGPRCNLQVLSARRASRRAPRQSTHNHNARILAEVRGF